MILHADDHDFRQLAAFDRPVAPRTGFANALRRQLVGSAHTAATTATEGAAPMLQQAVPTVAERPWRVPRWMRTIEAAVAVLVVISLVAASFALRQPRSLYDRFDDDRIVNYGPALSSATPEAEPSGAEVNEAGDAGRTWVMGDTDPTMGSVRIDPPLGETNLGFSPGSGSRFIVDDSLVYPVEGNDGDSLVRYDLAAQQEMWSIPVYVTSNLVSDGANVFGVSGSRNADDGVGTLVAISIATGEIVWGGPRLAQRTLVPSSIVISGDTLYTADDAGNVFAVRTADGSIIWQTQLPGDSSDEPPSDGWSVVYVPEMVVDSDWLFVTNPDQSVTRIDRETGGVSGTLDVERETGDFVLVSLLQLRDDRLVVTAVHQVTDTNEQNPETPATLLIVDAASLEIEHRVDLADLRGNAVLTDDTLYVPLASGPNTSATVTPIDLSTGELGTPFDGVSTRWNMFLSASGDTLMATGDTSTVAFFDLGTGEHLASVDLGIRGLESSFHEPVRLWRSHPIVITPLGDVYVVTEAAEATPATSIETNWGGDAGMSWIVGDTDPAIGAVRIDPPVFTGSQRYDGLAGTNMIVADDLFLSVEDRIGSYLVRYNLRTQEEVWALPIVLAGQAASDGERLYAMRGSREDLAPTTTMVAIDIDTGEIVWEGPALARRMQAATSIVLSGEVVFAADYLGNVVAVHAADGSPIWQVPATIATPSVDMLPMPDDGFTLRDPDLVVNDAYVFITGPGQQVIRLDRETGELTGTLDVATEIGSAVQLFSLQVRGDRLVVIATPEFPESEAGPTVDPAFPMPMLILNAETLGVEQHVDLVGFRGNAVLTDDAIYLPLASDWESPVQMHRIDLITGEIEGPLGGTSATMIMHLSASGDILMATGDPSAIGFYNLTTGEFLGSVELGIIDPESEANNPTIGFDRPVRVWDGQPIVITPLGDVYVVTDEPIGTPVATPASG
jgi:outer membrane protein assembly factor BamB